eukprot:GHUV01020312.1.p1 GENE.GHUV01020312.1~~GHUV01020312.1.p1  ORF type:complete len:402 (+),score=61.33 GHUV01020312.1:254-1459(+)
MWAQHCGSWLLLLVVVVVVSHARAASWRSGTEISPTISLFRLSELTEIEWLDGVPGTRCEHMVNHAATYGSTKINFMTTHFFIDTEGDHIPNSYCYKGTNDCLPFTQDVIANWTSSFTKCLQHAVAKGFTGIAVTPHLDGWGQFTPWRNSLRVNPLAKYSGFSYTDIMLVPLAHALNAVMTEDMTVWFALQGEMSLMAMMYPREHQRLLPYLKSLVIKDNPTQASQVRMGLSINFNKLCDGEYCSAASSSNPLLNPAAIQALFQAINFIGISAYPAYTPGSLQGFEDTIMSFVWEIKWLGVDVANLVNVQGKEFILSEYGIGGGSNQNGAVPARTADVARDNAYFGVFGTYDRRFDPWMGYLPNTVIADTKQYLEDWYRGAALWLSRKGGPTIRVDAAFIW